ncbi:MAG: CHAT domain-containing protein [Candidatus Helarchaeota archaeon]
METETIKDAILQLLESYYNLDNKKFTEEIESKFKIFEELDNIEDEKIQSIGYFLYSLGLSILAEKVNRYKFRDIQFDLKNKAYNAIMKAYDYFKDSDNLKLLEHIYDQLIMLLWEQIPKKVIIIDEKIKLYQELIEYCKKQEEVSRKLGDKAFLKVEERIPFRYLLGEFSYYLNKGTISQQEATEANKNLIKKIQELEHFDFPKAKFWANKWKRKVCHIEGNNKLTFSGSTLYLDGENIKFTNNDYNRSVSFKLYFLPNLEIKEQKAYPEMRFFRTGLTFMSINPIIERIYEEDLKLNFKIEKPQIMKGDPFARDVFSILPQKMQVKDYVFVIETQGIVEVQENATLIIQDDVVLRINFSPFDVEKDDKTTKLKFKLIKRLVGKKNPRSKIKSKEELDYMGFGHNINFTLYCNVNPTFSGVFIFTDPTNWKYCLSSCLYINKLKYKQNWYPNFLNFDYTPILFLDKGKISEKFLRKSNKDIYSGFLKEIGNEFPGLLNQILIFGEFMMDYSVEECKEELMNLIYLMSSLSGNEENENKSNIIIYTSNKEYYNKMRIIEDELNYINKKLSKTYKTSSESAITIKYIEYNRFISEMGLLNKKVYDHEYDNVYLVEDPVIAFSLLPLIKYTQSGIIIKDELSSENSKKILLNANQIWAIGNFEGIKIPRKATTKIKIFDSMDNFEHIIKINNIFKSKIVEDFQNYTGSEYLQRVYPGYGEKNLVNNSILTSFSENDYSFLTLASNYGANKPAMIWIIKEDEKLAIKEHTILNMLSSLRFTSENSITQEDIIKIGESIREILPNSIQNGLENSQNIIIISRIPIPFELYSYSNNDTKMPLCILKSIGRVCSTDISDTSVMLTFNMLRRMVSKLGEKVVIIAPKYEGEYKLEGAIKEAKILKNQIQRIFGDKIIAKIDEQIDKEWLFNIFKTPLKIIHFSGHGHFIDNKSCLILSTPEEGEPEFLFQEDLEKYVKEKGLIEGYPLVFTSACITGQIQKAGSGIEGLAAQFIKSGANCFIGTLWEIMDESARKFATYIYKNLQQIDKTIGELLLESRLELYNDSLKMLDKSKFFDPTCFSFIFFGDPTIKIR